MDASGQGWSDRGNCVHERDLGGNLMTVNDKEVYQSGVDYGWTKDSSMW